MSLDTMAVFLDFVQRSSTETLQYNINLFNSATRGGILLGTGDYNGDFFEAAMYQYLPNIVRRRDPRAEGALADKELTQIIDRSVKVAAGTFPMRIDNHFMTYVNRSPEEHGVVIGRQFAEQMMEDMVKVAVLSHLAAMSAEPTLTHDVSARVVPNGNPTMRDLNRAAMLMGDQFKRIVCWVMHSDVFGNITDSALQNTEQLFTWGNVAVYSDHIGRPFVVTDLAALENAGDYSTLGLVPGAVMIARNDDYKDVDLEVPGFENIQRRWQAQWTYQAALKGRAWDNINGGESPNDAALGTATNWDQYVTSKRDLGGVTLVSTATY